MKRAPAPWTIDLGGVAAAALMAGALFVGAVRPVLDRGSVRAERQAALRQAETRAADAANALKQARATLARLERERDQRTVKLSPVTDVNLRVRELASLASRFAQRVTSIEPAAPEPNPRGYSVVRIRMAGVGYFDAISEMFSALHAELPDTAVWSFALTGRAENQDVPPEFEVILAWHAVSAAHAGAAPKSAGESP